MEITINADVELIKYWIIRIIEEKEKKKECIAEYKCFCEPNEEFIARALFNNRDKNVFAVVEEAYKIVRVN